MSIVNFEKWLENGLYCKVSKRTDNLKKKSGKNHCISKQVIYWWLMNTVSLFIY